MLNIGLVDGAWYLARYPDVAAAIDARHFRSAEHHSAEHHYVLHGIMEGRLPREPDFDEGWYLRAYPEVSAAIRRGQFSSAFDHFVEHGYRQGYEPNQRRSSG